MKRPILIFITIAIFTLLIVYYFTNIYGWMEFHTNTDTPDQFLNRTAISGYKYDKDKSSITTQLKNLLLRHKDFFHSKEYFEGTEIIIDTILYSPDHEKLAILIITKNPTSRQHVPDPDHLWYYDATSYLGIRQNDSVRLSWIGPNLINSKSKEDLTKEIRDACFRTFVTKDTTGFFANKYNLNDSRFWDSDVWKRVEETEQKKKEFEKMKRENPENVYEPKDDQ